MSKYLCLDIGNVLYRVDFYKFNEGLSKSLNLTYDEVSYFLNRVQKLHDMGLTCLNDELVDHFKVKSPALIREIESLWLNVISPEWKVIEAVSDICHEMKINLALLSNIGFEHARVIEKDILNLKNNYSLPSNTVKWFSCFVGARKPSLIYYQSFLKEYPEFKGCLYIDDNHDNLMMGKNMGFNSQYFNVWDDLKATNKAETDIYVKDKLIQIIKSEIGN